ncbi:MAG: hypothetical protein AVDCRST_MAG53-3119, partial [uncultured Solirubrobacteraceae bacterium]
CCPTAGSMSRGTTEAGGVSGSGISSRRAWRGAGRAQFSTCSSAGAAGPGTCERAPVGAGLGRCLPPTSSGSSGRASRAWNPCARCGASESASVRRSSCARRLTPRAGSTAITSACSSKRAPTATSSRVTPPLATRRRAPRWSTPSRLSRRRWPSRRLL